jgi:hypothetical protein
MQPTSQLSAALGGRAVMTILGLSILAQEPQRGACRRPGAKKKKKKKKKKCIFRSLF